VYKVIQEKMEVMEVMGQKENLVRMAATEVMELKDRKEK
jgi:hypothetical protein